MCAAAAAALMQASRLAPPGQQGASMCGKAGRLAMDLGWPCPGTLTARHIQAAGREAVSCADQLHVLPTL